MDFSTMSANEKQVLIFSFYRDAELRGARLLFNLLSHVKDADLNKAMNDASMGMIKWLESEKKIARLDAYGLASVAMDCRVGAISDTEKNVHCLMPKSIWIKR